MYNQEQMYMNSVYYTGFLSMVNVDNKEQIESLNFADLIAYLTETVKCLYAYLCGKEVDETFFENIFYKVRKITENLDEKQAGVLKTAITNVEKFYMNVKQYKKTGQNIPHIIFLIGNPGSGKSHIARMLSNEDTNVKVIKKYTTRPKRNDEIKEVAETQSGVSVKEISNMKYKFQFTMNEESNLCAVDEKEIISAIMEGKNPVIATTSLDLYQQIVRDFPCQTHLIQIDNLVRNENFQEEIFKVQGRSKEEIKNRLLNSTVSDIRKYDYNLRVLINPIYFLKKLPIDEQKSFIYTQLKKIFQQFGSDLKLDFKESEYLSDYDEIYVTTMFRNFNNLYPFLSGMYDEQKEDYLNDILKKGK